MQIQQKSCQLRNYKSVDLTKSQPNRLQPLSLELPNSYKRRMFPPKPFRGYEKHAIKRVARSFDNDFINSNSPRRGHDSIDLLVYSTKEGKDIQFWATSNVLIFKKSGCKDGGIKNSRKNMTQRQLLHEYVKNNENTEALMKNTMIKRNIRTSNNNSNSYSPEKQVLSPTLRRRILKTNAGLKNPVIQPQQTKPYGQEDFHARQKQPKFEPSPWDSTHQFEDFDIQIS